MDKKTMAIYIPAFIIACFTVYTFQKATHTFEMFQTYSLQNVTESMVNGNRGNGNGDEDNELLLADSFPVTSDPNKLTNNQFSNIWWQYPSLKLSTYNQITNNIRYNRIPENGYPQYADFSGAFYRPIHNKSNYVKVLPLAPLYNARRVNYYLSH
jgi:hypothetical protein